jgi:hypothetical protein
MPIQVASNIIPKGGAKWPVLEDVYVKGGLRAVADATARDSLYTDATAKLGLKVGMFVVLASDYSVWQYQGSGLWVQFKQSKTLEFTQTTPSDTWSIAHNFNTRFFTYTAFDDDGYQITPDNCHIVDLNNLELTFAAPTSGAATFIFS